jgi:hypothetical protein
MTVDAAAAAAPFHVIGVSPNQLDDPMLAYDMINQ